MVAVIVVRGGLMDAEEFDGPERHATQQRFEDEVNKFLVKMLCMELTLEELW